MMSFYSHELRDTRMQLLGIKRRSLSEGHLLKQIVLLGELYLRRYQTRAQLRRLTLDQLEDIGITLEQARAESAKPFWR